MKNGIALTIVFILTGCGIQPSTTPNLDNVPMPSIWAKEQTITLHNGSYTRAAVAGSASTTNIQTTDYFASGTTNDQQILAIILTTTAGGSGTFYDLYLFTAENNKLFYADHTPLGDRIKIRRVTITDNLIQVSLTTHRRGSAMSSKPDLPLVKSFIFANRKLSEPKQPKTTPTKATPPPVTLAGKTFYWQSSLYGNDTQESPDVPAGYSITFNPDWSLAIQSDCNKTSGLFGIKGSKITIKPNLPLESCGEHSLSPVFIRDLTDAVNVIFQKDNLYIDLIYDSGTLILSTSL